MLNFHDFINEQDEVLDVDARHVEQNMDALNAELDKLTEKPYQNAPIFLAQLRGTLERFGMLLPSSATPYFMELSAEIAYTLGDSGQHLYIVYDTHDDGFVDGYAQLVSSSELSDLMNMDSEDLLNSDRESLATRHSDFYRKRDDDSGDTSEY
jgi:hypothetical protein